MGDPAKRRATYQDVIDAPEHMVAEIIDGELLLHPRPAMPHAAASSALGEELGPPFKRGRGGPGGWILLDGPELHFEDNVIVPDLAGWRRERMPVIPTDTTYMTIMPDWVCKVVSPGTGKLDRKRKPPIYARAGVSHVWLVDPLQCTLEVLRRLDAHWLIVGTFADDDRVRAEPFDAIELELGILWADVQLG